MNDVITCVEWWKMCWNKKQFNSWQSKKHFLLMQTEYDLFTRIRNYLITIMYLWTRVAINFIYIKWYRILPNSKIRKLGQTYFKDLSRFNAKQNMFCYFMEKINNNQWCIRQKGAKFYAQLNMKIVETVETAIASI